MINTDGITAALMMAAAAWMLLQLGFVTSAAALLLRQRAQQRARDRATVENNQAANNQAASEPARVVHAIIRPFDTLRAHEQLALSLGVQQQYLTPAESVAIADDTVRFTNRKILHVRRAVAAIEQRCATEQEPVPDIWIVADADAVVSAACVAKLCAAISAGHAIAVAHVRAETGEHASLAAHTTAAILNHSMHQFELIFAITPGAKPVAGKVIALSARALHNYLQYIHEPAEDLALTLWAERHKESVAAVGTTAGVRIDPALRWRTASARMLRWQQVLRLHRPSLSWLFLLFQAGALPSAFLFFVAAMTTQSAPLPRALFELGTFLAAVLLALRTILGAILHAHPRVLLWPLADAVLVSAWLQARWRQTFEWRGQRTAMAALQAQSDERRYLSEAS